MENKGKHGPEIRFPDASVRQVPAVSRAFAILRFLAKNEEPVGVQACARAVNLVPSTCLHILRVLVAEDVVVFDPLTKRYGIGMGLLSLGSTMLRHNALLRGVQSDLDRIAAAHGVTAMIANIMDDEHSVVVAISHSNQPLRFNVGIGSRYPTLIGASGRCFAAFSNVDAKEVLKRFSEMRWANAPRISEWKKEVELTRQRGYAIDVDKYIQGATVVSVPVIGNTGHMTSTVAAVGLTQHVDERAAEALAWELKSVAQSLASIAGAS